MIIVKDLWKSFDDVHVLTGLDLTINEGETLVILGRSGVGKSVLLKHIIGLLKPDKGQIFLKDICLTELSERETFKVNRDMGMLFQSSALFDSMTVGENIAFYLDQHGDPETRKTMSSKDIVERVKIALETVGLEGTQDKMPSELSGGMRKRAALARLIVYRPKIILYDEPTTGLDPITSMNINDLIIKTQQKLKSTSIVVTHDIKSALTVGDRLALHHEGKIVHIAPKDEFIRSDHPVIREFLTNASMSLDAAKGVDT